MQKLDSSDPATRSADLIAENVERLMSLFPETSVEGKIDFDVLRQLLDGSLAVGEEKYGINWHGKRRARQLALTGSAGTLRPCPDESVNWDTTQNLMIEGDNLEVLKLLNKSYAGKVKLIYIDPPYNTGNDFVYPDSFANSIKNYLELTNQLEGGLKISTHTEASGRFHTDWLNMIFPRMKLAQSLLARDGVILVSIDDQELANLKAVCEEIFGSENFIACLIWEKGRKNDAQLFSVGHEYVLVYAKSLAHLKELKTKWREEKPGAREIWEHYIALKAQHGQDFAEIERALQAWYAELPKSHPSKKWARYKHVDEHGPWRDDNISWPGGGGPRYDVIHPTTMRPCIVPERGWVFARAETMQQMIANGIVEFRRDHTAPPIRKSHLRPIDFETAALEESEHLEAEVDSPEDDLATQVRGSYFYKQSQVSVKHMRALMGAKVFDNPKDHEEIARLIDYVTGTAESGIVMDFFAGSGTTGEATWSVNLKNESALRFILVQLPEPLRTDNPEQRLSAEYCDRLGVPRSITELTKERLRRAAVRIRNRNPLFAGDLGFRVFKLASSNIAEWEPDREKLEQTLLSHESHLKAERTETDILYELLLKLGIDLCVATEKRSVVGKDVYSVAGGVLFVCLTARITRDEVEPLAQGILSWRQLLMPAGETTCVFRDSAFADDVAKSNLAAILNQHGISNVRSL